MAYIYNTYTHTHYLCICVRANQACMHAYVRAFLRAADMHVFIARWFSEIHLFLYECAKKSFDKLDDDEPSIVQPFIKSLSSECVYVCVSLTKDKTNKWQDEEATYQLRMCVCAYHFISVNPVLYFYDVRLYEHAYCVRYIRPRNRWMIAMADNLIDIERIKKSCKLSNTLEWFDSLCAMDAHRNIDAKMLLSKFVEDRTHSKSHIHAYISREKKYRYRIKIKIKTKKNLIQCVAEWIYGLVRSRCVCDDFFRLVANNENAYPILTIITR